MKKLLTIILIATTIIAGAITQGKKKKKKGKCCVAATEQVPARDTLASDVDTISYALGYVFAKQTLNNLQRSNIEIDSLKKKFITQAFTDVMNGNDSLVNEAALQSKLQEFATVQQQKGQAKALAAAEENKKQGLSFLAENKKRPEVTETASGLQYEVLNASEGPKPAATSKVTVHYHGTTVDGNVFDSSVQRGEPATFGLNQVIPGWTEGVQLMSIGSKYKFYIPSDLAYGDNGAGDAIPPGAVLIFEVELLNIQ